MADDGVNVVLITPVQRHAQAIVDGVVLVVHHGNERRALPGQRSRRTGQI